MELPASMFSPTVTLDAPTRSPPIVTDLFVTYMQATWALPLTIKLSEMFAYTVFKMLETATSFNVVFPRNSADNPSTAPLIDSFPETIISLPEKTFPFALTSAVVSTLFTIMESLLLMLPFTSMFLPTIKSPVNVPLVALKVSFTSMFVADINWDNNEPSDSKLFAITFPDVDIVPFDDILCAESSLSTFMYFTSIEFDVSFSPILQSFFILRYPNEDMLPSTTRSFLAEMVVTSS
mmetsp:Transcript_27709/g.40809  ORF Transcript_27709/g.40809 Transcript_27709/m.40809 type:complete len:236 (+) Transcript_27709:3711-4418(+)